jgi:hypothetical protein
MRKCFVSIERKRGTSPSSIPVAWESTFTATLLHLADKDSAPGK